MAAPRQAGAPATDADAVREVYLAHFGALAGWAAHLLGDRDLGHDVATEAFVRLLTHEAANKTLTQQAIKILFIS